MNAHYCRSSCAFCQPLHPHGRFRATICFVVGLMFMPWFSLSASAALPDVDFQLQKSDQNGI